MGNCIKRNRLVVLAVGNVRKYSHLRPHRNQHDHHNVAINTDLPRQNTVGFDNVRSEDAPDKMSLNLPPPSASMEANHRQSHPLPTPDLSSHSDNSKASLLALPEPETPKMGESNSILAPPVAETSSGGGSSSCVLPKPMGISESEILWSPNQKAFTLDQLRRATSEFSEDSMLGEGGFGCVYKGWLDEETLTAANPGSGMPVAIKKLIPDGFQGHKEWLSEVNYLGRLHHPNLVKLIGYCLDGEDRILVYEFMSGGCVEDLLFDSDYPTLSWAIRIKIAVGAARGLCFLHQLESPVIYRDFKTSNILLDSEYNAKLSDFGLAKAGPTDAQTHVTTRVMGTEGYCDPHYLTTGKLTVKCDIYSFGVVLLELITGRPAIDDDKFQEEKNLVNWVRLHVQDSGKIFRIMDTKLEGQYSKRSAYIAANIALRCVHHDPKYRPPMTYILDILENLQKPKFL